MTTPKQARRQLGEYTKKTIKKTTPPKINKQRRKRKTAR